MNKLPNVDEPKGEIEIKVQSASGWDTFTSTIPFRKWTAIAGSDLVMIETMGGNSVWYPMWRIVEIR